MKCKIKDDIHLDQIDHLNQLIKLRQIFWMQTKKQTIKRFINRGAYDEKVPTYLP